MKAYLACFGLALCAAFLHATAAQDPPQWTVEMPLPQLRQAAFKGDSRAETTLGLLYFNGEALAQNDDKAMEWFLRAKAKGNKLAEYYVSYMYFQGRGVEYDPSAAAEFYTVHAEEGLPSCQYFLGRMYLSGSGVAQDTKKAISWLAMAADQGDADAQYFLAVSYAAGKDMPADRGKAYTYGKAAASVGHPGALGLIGMLCENGDGVPQDYLEAYIWYSLAVAVDEQDARPKRDRVAQHLTPQQTVYAQREAARRMAAIRKNAESTDDTPVQSVEFAPAGTGFFITADGVLATSAHVVSAASAVSVHWQNKAYPANLLKVDKANDIALLRIDARTTPLAFSTVRSVRVGDEVCTIGFPNVDIQGQSSKFTKGTISSVTGAQDDPRMFQISIPVQPGNSGGPLMDSTGAVIGVVEARLDDAAVLNATGLVPQNVNYALKSDYLLLLLRQLPNVKVEMAATNARKSADFSDTASAAQNSIVLILVRQ